MERKGQGALEYLLLIGGAILVAVIVISILVGLGGTGGPEAKRAAANALCAQKLPNATACAGNVVSAGCTYTCAVSGTECRIVIPSSPPSGC